MEIKKEDHSLKITVPISKFYGYLFFFGVGTLVMLLSLFQCFFVFLGILEKDPMLMQQFLASLVFFLIFSMYFLWFLIGKEIVLVSNGVLKLVKTNGIITFSQNLKINEIRNVSVAEKKNKSDSFIDRKKDRIREKRRAFPFWISMGKLKINYKKNEKLKSLTFFNGIDNSEIDKVIAALKTTEIKID